MWTFYEKNKQAIHDIVLLLAAVLGCCLFFRYLFRIFLPFLIGWLLSLLFNPLADRLQKFHIPRGISAIIGILLLFALLGLERHRADCQAEGSFRKSAALYQPV